jgi:sec-independent protein translocase protein TatA
VKPCGGGWEAYPAPFLLEVAVEHHPVFVLGFGPHGTFGWIVIMLALLLIFGRRLPEVMRGLGSGVREFKKGMDEGNKTEQPHAPVPPVEGAVSRPAVPPPAAAPPAPADAPAPHTPPETKPH